MVLGGLKVGVTPLEMAKAYETLAHGGERVSGTLAPYDGGPVDVHEGDRAGRRRPEPRAHEARRPGRRRAGGDLDPAVRRHRAAPAAAPQIGEFAAGKTGTTENYQDAWFVGFNDMLRSRSGSATRRARSRWRPSTTAQPVAGGTFPAEIWHDFMLSAKKIRDTRRSRERQGADRRHGRDRRPIAPGRASPTQTPAPRAEVGKQKTPAGGGTGGGEQPAPRSDRQTPAADAEPAPQPEPQTPAAAAGRQPGAAGAGRRRWHACGSRWCRWVPSAPRGGSWRAEDQSAAARRR